MKVLSVLFLVGAMILGASFKVNSPSQSRHCNFVTPMSGGGRYFCLSEASWACVESRCQRHCGVKQPYVPDVP